ncbi:fimbria/pilus periplasmic chaperone [Stenotrophomonas sp. PS02301]|uniref:fimbrial biogenesis chaperone n=2 Tax=Stenotrophomonas TaxID=40323 RepID=UPI0030157DC4
MIYRVLLGACLLTVSCSAMAVSVGPTSAVYSPSETTGVLTVDNSNGDGEVTYRISVDEVVVIDSKSVRQPSNKIRFAPALITVQPGKTQTVRYLRGSSGASEEVYRIKMTQLPNPGAKGIQTLAHQDLSWIWRKDSSKPILVGRLNAKQWSVTNSGDATAQIVSPTTGGSTQSGLMGYVLPGETRVFQVPNLSGGPVSAIVNGQRMEISER